MRYLLISICTLFALQFINAKSIKMKVHTGDYDRRDCVVSVLLPSEFRNGNVVLIENTGKKKIPVASQVMIDDDGTGRLYWILSGETPRDAIREFTLKKGKSLSGGSMEVVDDQKSLLLKKKNQNILKYNYTITEPPADVDKAFARSGYIHPAYSPSGNVLTTIQPKDHRHHYGIWNPWTKLEYEGKIYDLWNLGDKKGTVRAGKINKVLQGEVCAGFDATLEHLAFTPTGEKDIMNEVWKVKSWNVPKGFLWDFESNLTPCTSSPVLLKEYRYAGFGWRATEEWTKQNSKMVSSEGKTRQQIDGTRGHWIYVTGECGQNGTSGLLIMDAPTNYNFPEPLRIWDENANGGRGDVFVNFAPTKNKDWNLEPGQKYTLRYRIYSYDGDMTATEADRLWNDFAYPPTVEILK